MTQDWSRTIAVASMDHKSPTPAFRSLSPTEGLIEMNGENLEWYIDAASALSARMRDENAT